MRKDLLASSLKAVRDGKAAAIEEDQKPRKLSGELGCASKMIYW